MTGAYLAATNPYDGPDGVPVIDGLALSGVGHILDAVLVVGDDGHAPGTRVRTLTGAYAHRPGTIVGAQWGHRGPPLRYRVQPDGVARVVTVQPDRLVVLDGGVPW